MRWPKHVSTVIAWACLQYRPKEFTSQHKTHFVGSLSSLEFHTTSQSKSKYTHKCYSWTAPGTALLQTRGRHCSDFRFKLSQTHTLWRLRGSCPWTISEHQDPWCLVCWIFCHCGSPQPQRLSGSLTWPWLPTPQMARKTVDVVALHLGCKSNYLANYLTGFTSIPPFDAEWIHFLTFEALLFLSCFNLAR